VAFALQPNNKNKQEKKSTTPIMPINTLVINTRNQPLLIENMKHRATIQTLTQTIKTITTKIVTTKQRQQISKTLARGQSDSLERLL
jgi:hypothetical protein